MLRAPDTTLDQRKKPSMRGAFKAVGHDVRAVFVQRGTRREGAGRGGGESKFYRGAPMSQGAWAKPARRWATSSEMASGTWGLYGRMA